MNRRMSRRAGPADQTDARQYRLWERGFELAVAIFKVADRIPQELGLTLTGQMRLAALSLPSHLSHSRAKRSPGEYARSLNAALQALADLESNVTLCCGLGYATENEERGLVASIRDMKRAVTGILRHLRAMLSSDRLQALSEEISALVLEEKTEVADGRS